jgi:hypothetical protein
MKVGDMYTSKMVATQHKAWQSHGQWFSVDTRWEAHRRLFVVYLRCKCY